MSTLYATADPKAQGAGSMTVADAQREMRSAFMGGFGGQLVSGIIWFMAAAISIWLVPSYGMAALFFGSMGIFPLTQLVVRLLGRPGAVSPGNGLWDLGAQSAFIVPPSFLAEGGTSRAQHHQ